MRNTAILKSLPRFGRFAIVGAIGFCVDTAALYAAIYIFGTGPYIGRVLSYLCAATTTWYLNRTFTFHENRSAHKGKEWLKFLAYNFLGGVANYGCYALYLHYSNLSLTAPVVGEALGACAGLIVNYTLTRHFVFTRTQAAAPTEAAGVHDTRF